MSLNQPGKSELLELMNVGPTMVKWLNEIEIFTKKDLESVDPVMTYRILKHQRSGVTLNALYSLYGALHGIRWDQLSEEEKARLREEASGDLDVILPSSE